MNYQKWLAEFRQMIRGFESLKGFEVKSAIGPEQSKATLEDFESFVAKRLGAQAFAIPGCLREFYRATAGIEFLWVAHPPAPHAPFAGGFTLATMSELFDPTEEEERYIPEDLGAGFSVYGRYRTFDDMGPESHILAKFSPEQDGPDLFWHTTEGGGVLCLLQMSFDQYLEGILASAGLSPWQQLFAAPPCMLSGAEQQIFFDKLDFLEPLVDKSSLRRLAKTLTASSALDISSPLPSGARELDWYKLHASGGSVPEIGG